MNRRSFFAVTVGLIAGACSDPDNRRQPPWRRRGDAESNITALDVESFREQVGLSDEQFKSIRKDIRYAVTPGFREFVEQNPERLNKSRR